MIGLQVSHLCTQIDLLITGFGTVKKTPCFQCTRWLSQELRQRNPSLIHRNGFRVSPGNASRSYLCTFRSRVVSCPSGLVWLIIYSGCVVTKRTGMTGSFTRGWELNAATCSVNLPISLRTLYLKSNQAEQQVPVNADTGWSACREFVTHKANPLLHVIG